MRSPRILLPHPSARPPRPPLLPVRPPLLLAPQNIKWMREAELKHGRMCMLAWTGYVAVDLGMRFPGEKYAALTSFTAHEATVSLPLSHTAAREGEAAAPAIRWLPPVVSVRRPSTSCCCCCCGLGRSRRSGSRRSTT